MAFFLSYVILAEIFAIMAISTNFLMGVIGIFSVSQAALMGVGAYVFAGAVLAGIPFLLALLLGVIACAILNAVTSLPSLRLEGDYFVVTSFGIQLVATAIFINWTWATGGVTGVFGIPSPSFFGYSTAEPGGFVVISTIGLLIASLGYWLTMRSSYGRVLHAIRQDETAVVAAGRDVLRMKLGISAVSGAFAGIGGALYAAFVSFIDPSSFDIHVSVLVVTMLVVGGARTLIGSLIGPFILLAIPQILTVIELTPSLAGPVRLLAFGLLLVVFMLLRPQGLVGQRL